MFEIGHKSKESREDESGYDFHTLMLGLKRHSLLVSVLSLLCFLAGCLYVYKELQGYKADAVLVVFEQDRSVDFSTGTILPRMSLQTVLELIKLPENFEAVQRVLGLDYTAGEISSMVSVPLPKSNSSFIHIIAKAKDPQIAMNVANVLAKVSVKASKDYNLQLLQQALTNYKNQLSSVMQRFNSEFREIKDFKEKNQYLEMTADYLQFLTIVNDMRSQLSAASLAYQSLVIEYESLKKQVEELPDQVPVPQGFYREGVANPLLSRISSLESALSAARLRYAEGNPRLKALEEDLKKLQDEALAAPDPEKPKMMVDNVLKQNLTAELIRMQGKVKSAEKTKEDLEASYHSIQEELKVLPEKQIEFSKLLRQQKLTEEEIKNLSNSIEVMQLMVNAPKGNIDIYQLAENSSKPELSPLLALLPFLAAGLGAGIGLAVAFGLELKDDKLHSRAQVEEATGISSVIIVPELPDLTPENAEEKMLFFVREIVERCERATNLPTHGAVAIAFGRSIYNEGTTLIAENVGSYYRRIGKNVLILGETRAKKNEEEGLESNIDTVSQELISSEDGEIISVEEPLETSLTAIKSDASDNKLALDLPVAMSEPLLSQYLQKKLPEDLLVTQGDVDRINIGGHRVFIMKELIKSQEMRTLWQSLKARYDIIIVDIPGLIEESYAVDLLALADIKIFIIDSKNTSKKIVIETMALVSQHGIRFTAAVLNRVLPLFIKDQRILNELSHMKKSFKERLLFWKKKK